MVILQNRTQSEPKRQKPDQPITVYIVFDVNNAIKWSSGHGEAGDHRGNSADCFTE